MTWRRVGLYYVILAALLAYYALFERQPRATPSAPEPAPLLDLALDRIGEMRVVRGEERVVCRLDGGRWRVVEPAGAQVPADLIAMLVTYLAEARAVEVVADEDRPADFGLAGAPVSIDLYPRAQRTPVTVLLGARNPAGTAVYARLGDSPRVLLVGRIVQYYTERLFEEVRASGRGGSPNHH